MQLHEAARSGPEAAANDLRRILHDLPATDTNSQTVRPRLVALIKLGEKIVGLLPTAKSK